ncbi:hypothetical protein [Maliponia aquimaris]|uniref:Type II CBASS E2 protein domain-containing protein n=1 Tax=Maliponia aquimaris TaxID=1673631 RepID=A0A238L6W9_9RHOB|nr:hypothetical protein [Maliponia aquimaris]SMX50738.1 hypothetical protein MAA8898_04956 [Maliponia aquimaris]
MKATARPKSREAQAERMREVWPGLKPLTVFSDGRIAWIGPVRGFQMSYKVSVVWNPAETIPPLVFVRQPTIAPRPGTGWIDIPHLLYDPESPEASALCLFDPEQNEWRSSMWISDTIVPWASEWLHHYELWHFDGVWRGANALGPISIGAGMNRPEKELQNVQGA